MIRRSRSTHRGTLYSDYLIAMSSTTNNKAVVSAAVTGMVAGYALCKLMPTIRRLLANSASMPALYYWPARGRGEQLRLIFAEAGVAFTDYAFDMGKPGDKEAFFKSCAELGGNCTTNVPMVKIDGQYLTQSSAVLRYLARRYGLYPAEYDLQACYECDNLIAAAEDLRSANYKPMAMFGGGEKEKEAYVKQTLPTHLKNTARLLGKKNYFSGEHVTVADLTFYDVLHVCECQVPGCILGSAFPTLRDFFLRMEARPGIADWIASEQRKKLFAFPAL